MLGRDGGGARRSLGALMAAVLVAMVACGGGQAQSQTAGRALKVDVMLFGSADDGSWNNAMADAVQALRGPYHLDVHLVENVSSADAVRAMQSLAGQGPDLIIAHAYEFGQALDQVAPQYPKVHFLQGTPADTKSFPNADKYDFRAGAAEYLAGMAAAAVSKNHFVAVTAGRQLPTTERDSQAFVLGAKAYDPKVNTNISYVGSYEDPAGGKETTTAQIGQGADVIYALGDGTAVGTLEAIKQANAGGKHVLVVGAYYNTHKLYPDFTLTSVEYRWQVMIKQAVDGIRAGKFGGQNLIISLGNGGVEDSPYYQFAGMLSPEAKAKIAKARQDLRSGALQLPPQLQ
jgi:basic membrane protein A